MDGFTDLRKNKSTFILDAAKHLYKRVCLSVRPYVDPQPFFSERPSVAASRFGYPTLFKFQVNLV